MFSRGEIEGPNVKCPTAVHSNSVVDVAELEHDSVAAGAGENVLDNLTGHHQGRICGRPGVSWAS